MPAPLPNTAFGGGGTPLVTTTALWNWDKSGLQPVVSGFPSGYGTFTPTKTGLTPQDLQNFVGVPIVYYGNPVVPVPPSVIQQWIRWAEDEVEQETSILLTQT